MTEPFSLKVYRNDLANIVQSVFQTMMDTEVEAAEGPGARFPAAITAAVHFAGEWRGATLVECGTEEARHFAARFMGIPVPGAIDDDVRDVMGELANMVAGNLKSLLPRGVELSMPSVIEGSDYAVRICGGNLVERMAFTSAAGGFSITVVELLQKS
ncbi:MAG TPA: chemotaxis protein CheX [Bryobacteraceae bacterium]|nr:chemotaxis protein CheX [Bryobacteraceae bacterium]